MAINLISGQYLFIANCLLFLSFLQRNQLMFRIMIVSATIFFLINAVSFDIWYLDTLLLHSSFIIINLYTAYKLFYKIVPPELDSEAQYVYNSTFSKYLTKSQFCKLHQLSKRRNYRVNSKISTQGNGFISIFLVIAKPEEAEILLKLENNVAGKLDNFSWIGLVEYVSLFTSGDFDTKVLSGESGTWEINTEIKFSKKNTQYSSFLDIDSKEFLDFDLLDNKVKEDTKVDVSSSEGNSEFIDFDEDNIKNKKEVVLYEWTLQDLVSLYSDPEEGCSIKNSLQSLWLIYFSAYFKKSEMTNISLERRNSVFK